MTGTRGLARVAPPLAVRLLLLGIAVVLGAVVAVPTPARAAESGPPDDAPQAPGLGLQVADDVVGAMPHGRGQVAYTVELANAGETDLTEVTLTDRLPEGLTVAGVDVPGPWTCVLPSGSSTQLERDDDEAPGDEPGRAPPAARDQLHCTLDDLPAGTSAPPLTVTLQVPDDLRGEFEYGVAATAAEAEPVEATATTAVQAPDGELSVDLADDVADTVPHGGEFTWTVTVANPGPVQLTEVSVDDTLPADVVVAGVTAPGPWTCVLPSGTGGQLYCTLDALPAGASAPPLRVAVQVPEGVSGQLRNVVVADSAETDPVEASATTTVDVATQVLGNVIEKPTADAAPSTDADADAAVEAQAELARTGLHDTHRALGLVAVALLALGVLLLRAGRPVTAGR